VELHMQRIHQDRRGVVISARIFRNNRGALGSS
jgi:hypothetical protein